MPTPDPLMMWLLLWNLIVTLHLVFKKQKFLRLDTFMILKKKGVYKVTNINIDNTDAILLAISPTDNNGNPAPVQNPEWVTSTPEGVTIEVSPDGLKAYAVTNDGYVGQWEASVVVDVDLGDGVEEIIVSWSGDVSHPKATSLNPTSGTIVEKSTRPPLE